jgi:hypothetical protein
LDVNLPVVVAIAYLTVPTEEVRMIHENMVETTGISTQSLMIRNKECEYFMFDFISRALKSSTAVQNYIGEEPGRSSGDFFRGQNPFRSQRHLDTD